MATKNRSIDYSSTIERFKGIGDTYNASRPSPPVALINALTTLAGIERPHLVTDLGCGSGLSSRIWADTACKVVGIDPNWDMLSHARDQTQALNINYLSALSIHIAMRNECADIITCAQSLHWMEPAATFSEVARLLRLGGVFAAYDYDWPPETRSRALDHAYRKLMNHIQHLEEQTGMSDMVKKWPKQQHLERMRATGLFRSIDEFSLFHEECGTIERLLQLILSQGSIATLIRNGLTEKDLGLTQFKDTAMRSIGSDPSPWLFHYRVRVAIK